MQGQLKWIVALTVLVSGVALSARQSQHATQFELVPKILFSSNRAGDLQNPACNFITTGVALFLMDPDGTHVQRLTDSEGCTHGDSFGALSPDGKKIVFDSTRIVGNFTDPLFSRLFVMESDGTEMTFLTPGSSATWSSDSKYVAFAASASYYASNGLIILPPIRNQPGSPAIDNDIFVANVDDLVGHSDVPHNLTNTPDMIEEDADWSPDGTKIVFTSDPFWDFEPLPGNPFNYPHKELYVINADGTGLTPLTFNTYEERSPAWSPDGTRIAFIGRVGRRGGNTFEICVINADGSDFVQLTDNARFEGTMTWSPDGRKIIFQSPGGANP